MAEQKTEEVQPPENCGYNDGDMYGNAILKQGELMKKGTGFTSALSWNTRYFILRANGDFSYYKDKKYQQVKGSIDLRKVYKVQRDKKYLYLQTKERKWDLYSENSSALDEWEKLLRKASTKEDYIEFRIQDAECLPVICNNQLYGFIGEGLAIQITPTLSVFSEITFCSFVYPKEEKTICINSDAITLNFDGQTKCFKLNQTHAYERPIEKKSVTESTVLSNVLMQQNTDLVERLHNFVDNNNNDEIKCNYNENDIFINIDLQCNFSMTAQHSIALTGQVKKGLFGKSDNRKLCGTVQSCLTAYVKATYDVLKKNNKHTREQWWIYRNKLMDEAFEQRRLELEQRIDELVLKGKGNRINLLPFYMKQKIPMKEYELKPIWNRILNKKFLCHEQPIMVNRCGEIMNKKIYVMAEIQFEREETYEYPLQLCDTLFVGPRGRILKTKYKITDIFQFEGYYGQNIQHGTFHGVINFNGKEIIQNKWYLCGDNRVQIEIRAVHNNNNNNNNEHKHQNKNNELVRRAAEIKIFAKKKEQRYFYRVNGICSYTNDVMEQLPSDYPRGDCVIL